ncbi:acyltransferase family protein [uncultured Cytophaga sp.]|uniref:acyltransferase family protein n=1 Tax=uncultured Cytophaga sp. TaxID=160238 RepID=UPI00260FAC24|nr:acyltransferase family protein [uncultured Cytophaga sp.]
MKYINLKSPGLFRLFLALIVVMHHCVDFLVIGHAAVFIFFILSGYWIAKMYNEKYTYYINPYKVFIISRTLRLMPVYYLVLIISIIVAVFYKSLLTNVELNNPFFYLTNLFIIGQKNANYLLIGTGWSLDIELQFYLFAPFIYLILLKLNHVVLILITILSSIIQCRLVKRIYS